MPRLSEERLAELNDEINELADQYECADRSKRADAKEEKTKCLQQIWLDIWEMKNVIRYSRNVRTLLYAPPSTIYESADDFFTGCLVEFVPILIKKYRPVIIQNGQEVHCNFMQFFNGSFPGYLRAKFIDAQWQEPYDCVIVTADRAQLYSAPFEDAVIENESIEVGKRKRVVAVEPGWIRIELKKHGRHVYVREQDVSRQTGGWSTPPEDDGPGTETGTGPDQGPGPEVTAEDDALERYLLVLLDLWEQLLPKREASASAMLTQNEAYRFFYTETLINFLQAANAADLTYELGHIRARDLHGKREEDMIAHADPALLDYLLEGTCRSFRTISRARVKTYGEHKCSCTQQDQPIYLPASNQFYAAYLEDAGRRVTNTDSFAAAMSRYWAKYNRVYLSLTDSEYHLADETKRRMENVRQSGPRHHRSCRF